MTTRDVRRMLLAMDPDEALPVVLDIDGPLGFTVVVGSLSAERWEPDSDEPWLGDLTANPAAGEPCIVVRVA